ncbi:MAG TPA: hypothetical protein VFP32_03540 [Candidatus Saccharimonadales bacterium]|nr:hypothetical protein [Candidatus Saccharimonadales bacterium]
MPDEDRVFDVSKPGQVGASPTSRPIIVGHQPQVSDPMVRDTFDSAGQAIKINVQDMSTGEQLPFDNDDSAAAAAVPDSLPNQPPASSEPARFEDSAGPAVFPSAEPESLPPAYTESPPAQPEPLPESVEPGAVHSIEDLHVTANKKRHWPLGVLIVFLVLIGVYLALDSGLIHNNLNLPVHIFKQKPAATAAPAPAPKPKTSNVHTVPAGFTEYRLATTDIVFDAPTAWGQPTSNAEPGYSKRGGTNQSDGTYAYTVNFASNKDVQVAVTSAKYLPPARTATYYDFLQWCTGTNDAKIYKSILHFTTTAKIDTPSTVTCDQGPLTDATELDDSTIVQLKTTGPDGKTVIGDLYTKNLTDPELVVLRVKDAAMTNGDNIKTLLGTVQVSPGSTQ